MVPDAPTPPPAEQAPGPLVADLFKEMDEANARGEYLAPGPEPVPPRPISFKRLVKTEVSTTGQAEAALHKVGEQAAAVGNSIISKLPYKEWLHAISNKYRALLKIRTADEFIDISRLNTVMAEYGDTYCEITREAQEAKDAAEDAKEEFTLWWDKKVTEARDRAATESKKFTSDTGYQTYARSIFAEEYQQRQESVKEAQRRSEFLGSLKLVIQTNATVLKAAGPSFAFEWTTAGGLKFFDGSNGNPYFGLSARRIGDRPPPHALSEASKRRSGAAPTG